jgi:hypothetical protein
VHRAFGPVIAPLLHAVRPETIVETGSGAGLLTQRLLGSCRARVHAIDPDPRLPEALVQSAGERLVLHATRSELAIPFVGPAQLAILDGDPNWYTVSRDLQALAADRSAAPPPILVVHHVHWPFGRRDGYYDPEAIPAEHRRPYLAAGLIPGLADPVPDGLVLAPFAAARDFEPRSGVLAAVEHFTEEDHEEWSVLELPGFHGLTVLAARSTLSTSPELGTLLEELESRGTLMRLARRVEAARVRAQLAVASVTETPVSTPSETAQELAGEPAELHQRADLEREDSQLNEELARALDKAAESRRQVERLEVERTALASAVERLEHERREQATRHEGAVADLRRDLTTHQSRTDAVRVESAENRAQRAALEWRLEHVEADLSARLDELGTLQRRVDEEHRAAVDATVRLEHATAALDEERMRRKSLETLVGSLEAQVGQLERTAGELRERERLLGGQLAHREDAHEAERSARLRAEQALDAVREQVEVLESRELELAEDLKIVAASGSWRFARRTRRVFRLLTFRGKRPESSVEIARGRLEREPALLALPKAPDREERASDLPIT